MASSRLEKIGTIYSRVTGLMRAGAMKLEDIPLWYNIYKAFPPQYEPRFDRPTPDIPIQNILYAEDEVRAKFHKLHSKSIGTINLSDHENRSPVQKFIAIYNKLKKEGMESDDEAFNTAIDMLKAQAPSMTVADPTPKVEEESSLVADFLDAQKKRKKSVPTPASLNIKDLLKD